jgi:hypothetical protein
MVVTAAAGAIQTVRRHDPDVWLAVSILIVVAFFPVGCLWVAIRLMKFANRDAQLNEELIAHFSALQSLRADLSPPDQPSE